MEQLLNFIIRPPRAEYNPEDDLLAPKFRIKGKWYQRKDLEVVNDRGAVLQCSHYMPVICPEGNALPCVIYCHGNSGCRTDASEAAVILLPSNITVFAFDFSGSGLSGGEFVTLGWNEKADLRAVVDCLRSDGKVSLIGLWGRSMGAVTSLMYVAEDPSIAGMILDSPFSDLVELMMELVDSYKFRLPKFTVKFAIQHIRRAIQKKAKFDIMDLNTIKAAKVCFIPALFSHAIDDDFIRPHHSDLIFDAYAGDKNIIKFEGDHNSPRPQFSFDSISIFFNNVLQPPLDELKTTFFDLTHDGFGKDRWSLLDLEFSDEVLESPDGSAGDSTKDAMEQLHTKPAMSTMVVPGDISSADNQPEPKIEIRGSESLPSSSNMISLGSRHGSDAPGSIDEDRKVQHHRNSLSDFPTNIEEEERMIMEAVLKSLKDLQHPRAKEASSDSGIALLKPELAPNNQQDGSSACDQHKLPSDSETPGTSHNGMLRSHSLPEVDMSYCSKNPTSVVASPNPIKEQTSRMTSDDNAPSGKQRSSDVDMTCCLLGTSQVEEEPSIVGHCWDLNFFRNR